MTPTSEHWLAAMESQTTVTGGAKVLQHFLRQGNADEDTGIALLAAFRHLCTVAHSLDREYLDQAHKDLPAGIFAKGMKRGGLDGSSLVAKCAC